MSQDEQSGLIVWCANQDTAAPLIAALQTRYDLDVRFDLQTLPEMKPELGSDAGAAAPALLLIYQPVADVLHQVARNGHAPTEAIALWQEQARALLALHRQNRRQTRLVDTGQALSHPAAFCEAFGVSAEALTSEAAPQKDDVLSFVARQYLLEDPEGRALSAELEAASLRLEPLQNGVRAAEAAFNGYRHTQNEVQVLQEQSQIMEEELSTLNRDREALNDALNNALEAAGEAERRAEDRIAQLQSRGDVLEAELTGAQTEQEAARQQAELQIELLQAQTRTMQEELEAMAKRAHETEARVKELNQGLESYQKQIAELRGHQAGLGRKLAAKEQGLQAVGRQMGMLEAHIESQRNRFSTRLGTLQSEIADLHASKAAAVAAQAETEGELARVLSSRSMRITAPMRRLIGLLTGRGRS